MIDQETIRQQVAQFHADYAAETAQLIAAGKTDDMSRAMDKPRICPLCATIFEGGGECTGTPEDRHREVILYASNE